MPQGWRSLAPQQRQAHRAVAALRVLLPRLQERAPVERALAEAVRAAQAEELLAQLSVGQREAEA